MRYLIVGALGGALLVGLAWWWVDRKREPPEVAELPPPVADDMVPVETVRTIPGEPTIVERVRWRTREAPVDPAKVLELARQLCPRYTEPERPPDTRAPGTVVDVRPAPELYADMQIDADKHIGLVGDRIAAGWVGEASCRVRTAADGPWTELLREPFSESQSIALSEVAPDDMLARPLPRIIETAAGLTSAPGARLELRWYGNEKRWGFWASSDWQPDADASRDEPGWVVAGGVARRWGAGQ